MSVTWADIDEQVRELAGFPNWQMPNFQVRMSAYLRAARWIVRKAQSAPAGLYISQFRLQVSSGQDEYNIPREDFNGLDSVVADPLQYPGEPVREIEIMGSHSDVDLTYGARAGSVSGNQRVLAIVVRDNYDSTSGENNKKLITYPKGAIDNLLIYYRVLPTRNSNVTDACPVDESTALGLLPAIAIKNSLWDQFVWDSYSEGEDLSTKRNMLKAKAEVMIPEEYDQFEQEIFYTKKAQPSQKRQGMTLRQARRRIRGRYR